MAPDPILMTIYLGWSRDTAVEVEVVDIGCGAGRIACPECEGTGNWGPFLREPVEWWDCVQCKGTGWWLVSI